MKMAIFCVHDRATQVFGTPMFLLSKGQAIRSFSDEVNRAAEDNQLYRHPDDFDLYELGDWETETGEFFPHAPVVLVRGKDVQNKLLES